MILDAARAAASRLFSPEFRSVFLKTLGLTLLALVALWFGLTGLFEWLALPWLEALLPGLPAWAGWLGVVIAGIGLALGMALLIAPVTAIVAGLFLDDVAEVVERTDYPGDPPGRAMPALRSLVLSIQILRRRHPRQHRGLVASPGAGHQHRRFLRRQRLFARARVLRVCRHALSPRGRGPRVAQKIFRHGVPGRDGHCRLPRRAAAQPFDAAVLPPP